MSHGATGTEKMDFTNDARSLNAGANATAEKRHNTNGTLSTTFGSGGNAWGSSDIWSGGLSANLAVAASTRENSMSRGMAPPPIATTPKDIEGKTGSGSLVDSSVCDDYATKPLWGVHGQRNSNANASRSIPQARYPDNTLSQKRGLNNAGLSQTNMNSNAMSYAPRAPTVNLNSTAPAQARTSFGSAAGTTGRGSEKPPFQVYTKYDRPSDPMLMRKSDSAYGSWVEASTPSPSDERRPQYPFQYNGRTASMPTSRDGSDPPSRHSDQKPEWPAVDCREMMPNSSREPSLSAQRNEQYSYLALQQANAEQMAMQFGQLDLGAESRPSTSHRPSLADGYGNGSAGRSSLPYSGNGMSRSGSIEEVSRSSRNHSIHDEYNMPQQANVLPPYSSSSYTQRFLQSGNAYEFRPGQPYQGNSIATRSHDMPGGARQMQDWNNYSMQAPPSRRRSPGLSDPPYINPDLQQYLAAQLRQEYIAAYYPYAMQNAIQAQVPSPYLNMMPINTNMNLSMRVDPASMPRESMAGEGVQSALMYEFKSNTKSKRYELRDIYDHIAEFSGDQHGSRFIQTKLETANSDEKERVFREIQPNAIPLMTDVFGNYVIQKFFEHGDQTHKKILANKMRGHVLQLSLQMYGCRVVQKALDHVLVDQQAVLIGELENHVSKCVKDQNGNHVIQKAIERCPPATIEFIIKAFYGQVQQLSIHAYGCRVIQRCLEKSDLPGKAKIMSELLDAIPTMISDQYGNYVVQHIVSHDDGEGRRRVLRIVSQGLEGFSKHKFASNVVEKCLERADDGWRHNVVFTLAQAQQQPRRLDHRESEGVLVNMIKDNFGNYVIQKLLDTLCRDDYFALLDVLGPAMVTAKRTGCGKQVVSIDKKMHRFDDVRNGSVGSLVTYGRPQFPMHMPMAMPAPPQFVTNYNSAATTPPPLTADTQSLQSSRVPSINGDAIEGASASRKGSAQSNDFF